MVVAAVGAFVFHEDLGDGGRRRALRCMSSSAAAQAGGVAVRECHLPEGSRPYETSRTGGTWAG